MIQDQAAYEMDTKRQLAQILLDFSPNEALDRAGDILDVVRTYPEEFGHHDPGILTLVSVVLELDALLILLAAHHTSMYHTLRKINRVGHQQKVRLRLSENDRAVYDAALVLKQLERCGGQASAPRLQRVMSGCHNIPARDLKPALAVLLQLELVTEEFRENGQWWNPRRYYYLNEILYGSTENESEPVQKYSVNGTETKEEKQPLSPQFPQELTRSA